MMKRVFVLTLCFAAFLCTSKAEVNPEFAAYGEYGAVLSAEQSGDSVTIEAEGYYGYHMDEDPSMSVRVEIGSDGVIRAAAVTASKAQTEGFAEQITQEYMEKTYVGAAADPMMETDAVSGATATSQAVRYAVQTAAYYAQNALGYVADTNAEDKAELSEAYPAQYETLVCDYSPSKEIGTLLYAALGTGENGEQVVGMKVKSALRFAYKGSAGTGWTASEPGAFTMDIVVDKATNQVVAWKILVDGTKRSAYFTVPQEKIDAYKSVVIDNENVFDEFMDGIVLSMDYETEPSEDGPVITGTSIVYTGKTEQGTFSSQLVRNCFRAAAAVYCNLPK